MNTTAVELIPAPGAGKVIMPIRAIIKIPAGTAFAGSANLQFHWVGETDNLLPNLAANGFLTAATAEARMLIPAGNATLTPATDKAVEMNASAAMTAGRAGLEIDVTYIIAEA